MTNSRTLPPHVLDDSRGTMDDHDRPEEHAAVARLLSSATFERSARARELFEYLTRCRFSGRVEDAKEQIIGERLFGRTPGYNSAEDNIVRVAARQLRAKLHEYYEAEGSLEAWVVEIPKGSYLPHFHLREEAPASTKSAAPSPVNWTVVIPWTLCALLLVLVAIGLLNRAPESGGKPLVADTLVRLLAPKPGQHLNIVVVDASLQIYRELTGRTVELGDYISRNYLAHAPLPPVLAPGSPLGIYMSREFLTQQYCLPAINRVYESVPLEQISVRHPQQMTARDFETDNALLIGGPWGDPWAQLFENKLAFRVEPKPGFNYSRIRNVSPAAGERELYDRDQIVGTSYSRISYRPNLNGTGVVLLVGGPTVESTEAAGRFVASSTGLRELFKLMNLHRLQDLPPFDLLMEVVANKGPTVESRIVAWRRYPPSIR